MKGYALTPQQGKVIKEVCREKGIKLLDLARGLGILPSHLSNTFAGKRNLQPYKTLQLHSELGFDHKADFLKDCYSRYVQNHGLLYLQDDSQPRNQKDLEQILGPLEHSLYDAFRVHYRELGIVFVQSSMEVKTDILFTMGDLYRKYAPLVKKSGE